MIPTREMNPFVPLQASEIIDDVLQACETGITIVHLHARDINGKPTYTKEEYLKTISKLREYAPDLILCTSLSGRNFNTFEKRSEVLDLYPDMGSLTLSSMNFPKTASVNDPDMIQSLAQAMLDKGVKPELEVFDLGMIHYADYLISKGLLKPPYYFNIITGNIAGMQTFGSEIGLALARLPKDSFWTIGGVGAHQLYANTYGLLGGGGVRVGLEDNLYFDRQKSTLASNQSLLKRVHGLMEIFELELMTSAELGRKGFYNSNIKRHAAPVSDKEHL